MSTPSFDLIDVVRTIQKQKRIIIIITLIAVGLGGIFFAVKKKKFKAASHFLVNNPLYGDRQTLFRATESRWIDFFGGDDDLDRVVALLNSDTVRDRIIRNCQFQDVYKSDINSEKGHAFLMSVFDKNFNVKRSEYKDIEVSYIAYDSVTAANVANMSVKVAGEVFRDIYTTVKTGIVTSINKQVQQLDSSIKVYTDSLTNMREKYGVYSVINPARQNMMSGEAKGSGANYARGMEEVQNIESIKDQLVMDRAHDISLLNEYSTSASSSMEYLKVISRAQAPTGPTGASITTVLGVAGFLGLIFSTLMVLVLAYYNKLMAAAR